MAQIQKAQSLPNKNYTNASVHTLLAPMTYNGHVAYYDAWHEAQCVELIRALLHVPPGTTWVEGQKVPRLKPGEKDPIAPGTPIATFINGKYPDWTGTGHAAIYLSQNQLGIQVLDQWENKKVETSGPDKGKMIVSERTIYWTHGGAHDLADDGMAYSVAAW